MSIDTIHVACELMDIPHVAGKLTDRDNAPWKRDDAEWFEANPTRRHRMRAVYEGEAAPGHTFVVLRRTGPMSGGELLTVEFVGEIPSRDDEAFLQALLDLYIADRLGIAAR